MARTKKTKEKLPTDHSDFAGDDADQAQIEKLADAGEKANKRQKRGDNKGPLSEETAKLHITLITEAQTNWRKIRDEATKAMGVLRNRYKVAKSDGLDTDALKRALSEAERPAMEVVAEHRNMARYLVLMESPLGTQLELLADAPSGDDRPLNNAMDAELQGQHAWSNGEPLGNVPFTPGTDDFALWVQGWNAAQAAAVEKMGQPGGASH